MTREKSHGGAGRDVSEWERDTEGAPSGRVDVRSSESLPVTNVLGGAL